MNKIHNIRQLQEEKIKLTERQLFLENIIRLHWLELKDCFRPNSILKEVVNKMVTAKVNKSGKTDKSDGVLKNAVAFSFGLLTDKLILSTWNLLERVVKYN